MEIGKSIRKLRLQKGLTLEELASRSELSKGFLSQLERDLTSPSIATLEDILEALGSNLADFFSDAKDEKFTFRRSDFFSSEKEGYSVTWIVPNTQKNQMEPILLELPAGGESFELEPHTGEEFGVVLEGSVVLVCDGKRHVLRRGETFYLHGKTFHRLKNERQTRARVLWVSTPPLF
ncbi:MAG: helix-turn-helix domain-containing protein [Oscillospiraceae bacterium]